MTFDQFIQLFPEAKPKPGGGYKARCPAHEDDKASLSIDVAADGKILLKCFAGCTPFDVVQKKGLKWSDLFPDSSNSKRREYVAHYLYEHEDGTKLATKHRCIINGEKDFRWQQANGEWNLKGVTLPLFRAPKLVKAPPGEPILIVEGERDVETAERLGFVATTNPEGAAKEGNPKWKLEYTEWLIARLGDHPFYVIPDNDEAGKQHAAFIIDTLLREEATVYELLLPGLPPKGDLSDWANGAQSGEDLRELMRSCPLASRNGKEPPERQSPFKFYTFAEICALPPPEWQVEDLFPETSFLEVFGQTWSGKSLVMMDLALNIAKASPTWCGRKILKPGPVVWINADGGRGITPRSIAWREANGDEFTYEFLVLMGNVQLNRADQMLAFRADLLAMDPRPVLVVFDTLSRCIPGVDENNQAEMTKVTDACHRMKLEIGCTVCLIHHTDKTGQWDRGSSIVKNETDTQIRIDKEEGSRIISVHSCKARDAAAFEEFYLEIHPLGDSAIVLQRDAPPPKDAREVKSDRLEETLFKIIQSPGITCEQLAAQLAVSVRTARRYTDDLVAAGDVLEADLPRVSNKGGLPTRGFFPTPR